MKTQKKVLNGVRGLEWPWSGRAAHGRQSKREGKMVLLEVPVCCPLACSGHFGWWFQFLIPIRRENVKLEQMWRRAVGV